MRPREFIAPIGGGADAWPLAHAQQPAMPVIGFLSVAAQDLTTDVAFRRGTCRGELDGQGALLRDLLPDAIGFSVLAKPKKPISEPDFSDVDLVGNSYGEN